MPEYYKVVADNRKARFDYQVLEVFTAGLVLKGNEVKALRLGQVNLRESFARVLRGEIWIYGMHITPYGAGDTTKIDPVRFRKVLLQKKELMKLTGKVSEKGLTLIPLKIFFQGNWAKVELGLAKAKKSHEKRDALRRRTTEREIERAFRGEKDV